MNDKETRRLHNLLAWERRLWDSRYGLVAGVDEAGRGALAGPVVAAAVISGPGVLLEGLDDSKKLTPRKRERLYQKIRINARGIGVGMIYQDEIDQINIFQATLKDMHKAIAELDPAPEYLLIDGLKLPDSPCPQQMIIDGDAQCYSIAAASIVAKVTRDRLMCELDKVYPQYGFARHKGYGTKLHLEALGEHKPCSLHRKTFRPVCRY
jgi:ribonuclease HII